LNKHHLVPGVHAEKKGEKKLLRFARVGQKFCSGISPGGPHVEKSSKEDFMTGNVSRCCTLPKVIELLSRYFGTVRKGLKDDVARCGEATFHKWSVKLPAEDAVQGHECSKVGVGVEHGGGKEERGKW
jgi:hypothetical protein